MIGIYYPYLDNAKKWEELRYSLRSLEKYFKEDYEVWIVGELPSWIQNVRHISHVKNERVLASCTYDAVTKLSMYLDDESSPELFVRMYDDIYLLRDICLRDIQVTRRLFDYCELHDGFYNSGGAVWRNQVMNTTRIVRRNGYPGYMTETHCPELFEKKKMKKIFEMFDVLENRMLTSTLYYNIFPFEKSILDRKQERALFYGADNVFSYASTPAGFENIKGKRFLNHNDEGLTPELKEIIQELFPEKCRFEK